MNVVAASDTAALAGILDRTWDPPQEVVAGVAKVLTDVRRRGDAAVVEWTRRFEEIGPDSTRLRVPIPLAEDARSLVSREIADALELEKERITRFHERQRQPDIAYVEDDGARYAIYRRPLRAVAVYAQRSGAACATIMGAVPARIAGVSRVTVVSPAAAGPAGQALMYACALCGVDELYAAGGAQGIAAVAYGTESVLPTDKIVGRGGLWTTEAKRQVFGRCGVDLLAGPPDVLVVADEAANSEYVVGELLSQAERRGVTRFAVLSESRSLLEAVAQLIDTLDLRTLAVNHSLGVSIADRCRLIAADSPEELYSVLNRFAPAYLSLQVQDAQRYLEHVTCAGSVLVGEMTPAVSGEYLAGTNRVIPSSGTARFSSNLSLSDFTRSFSVVENSAERGIGDAPTLASLAELERLPHHAAAARMRCGT